MPLSEHEQRMLDQIERELYNEDPKFANTVRQTNPQVHYRRSVVKACVGLVVGVVLLLGGVMLGNVYGYAVAPAGFLVMLGSALLWMSAWRRLVSGGAETDKAAAPQRQQRPGMMDRFEERWRRRQEGDS